MKKENGKETPAKQLFQLCLLSVWCNYNLMKRIKQKKAKKKQLKIQIQQKINKNILVIYRA